MEEMSLSGVFSVLKKRPPTANKGTFGTLAVIGGCKKYRGSAALAVLGGMRCGAGIVCLASVEKVIAAAAAKYSEPTFLPLKSNAEGFIAEDNAPLLLDTSKRWQAVVMGCGMGWCLSTRSLADRFLTEYSHSMLLDADGLNSISDKPQRLKKAKKIPIITPHPGELSRLTGLTIDEILTDPARYAREFSLEYGCVTLLKGAGTVIASPDGQLLVNPTGNAGLAKGGSGDLLAGMIGSFLAQGIDPYEAACCGAYLHGLAADRCAERLSQYAMQPSDIVWDLCEIFRENDR